MKCSRQKPRKQLTTEKRYKWIIIFISKGNTLFRQRKYVGEYQLSGRSNWIQNKLTTLVTSVKLENLFPTREVINRERLSVFFSGPSRFCSSYSHESFEDGGALGTTLPLHAFMETQMVTCITHHGLLMQSTDKAGARHVQLLPV